MMRFLPYHVYIPIIIFNNKFRKQGQKQGQNIFMHIKTLIK